MRYPWSLKIVRIKPPAFFGSNISCIIYSGLPNSPAAYFSNRRSSVASSVQRVGSSSRSANRSDVDFDKIPSPRPISSARRKSALNGRTSGLSRPSAALLDEDEDGDDGYNIPGPPSDYVSEEEQTPALRRAKRHLSAGRPSFAPMNFNRPDEDDEEDEGAVEEGADVEDEIAQGLEQVELPMEIDEPDDLQFEDQGQEFEEMEPVDEGHEPMHLEPEYVEPELEPEQEPEPEEEPEPELPRKGKGKGKGRARAANDSTEDQRPNKRTKKNADTSGEGETVKKPKKKAQKENVLQEGKFNGYTHIAKS